jgi:hypothetical protein
MDVAVQGLNRFFCINTSELPHSDRDAAPTQWSQLPAPIKKNTTMSKRGRGQCPSGYVAAEATAGFKNDKARCPPKLPSFRCVGAAAAEEADVSGRCGMEIMENGKAWPTTE